MNTSSTKITATPMMCHHTLKSLSFAVSRIPRTLMSTWGIMINTITNSWKYQFVGEPKTGIATSAGTLRIRVKAPMM